MDLGDTLTFRSNVYDKAPQFDSTGAIKNGAVLVNATTAALTITLPDGTTATPTVTNPPTVTGQYTYDYVTSVLGQSGRYTGQWLFTMSTGKTTSYVESFDVGGALITVDEALAHLGANGIIVNPDELDQLQWLCFVATDAVERDLGRVLVRRTVVETYDGGDWCINLRSTPVISIVSVIDSGTAIASTGYVLDAAHGILYRGTTLSPLWFMWGRQNIVVTSVAGPTDPPRIARKVALNAVQGMWQESQQASHPALAEFAEQAVYAAQGALTPIEQSAYLSLQAAGVA